MESFANELGKLLTLKKSVDEINPALAEVYPVAVVINDRFHVYDLTPEEGAYRFIKDIPAPMPVPQGVRAAFQLEAYGGRIACVVTPDVFDSQDGYITLLHEFVHCYQYETCEQELKMTLDIARQAQEQGDFMWEIQHPFPYTAEDFIQPYTQFLNGLEMDDAALIRGTRTALRAYLGRHDYEYMVWQEWKEGFARWVENQVKIRLGLPVNTGGLQKPYSRVTFYAGGEAYIAYLTKTDPGLAADLPELFHRMLALPSS